MAFTTKLELRQSHSLVMTPQLQQAIKLLQLSNMELAAFVETELERNPLLEREEADETGNPLAADAPEAAANLFAQLRALDRPEIARIAVMPIPQIGLGLAINDRLRRAAADDGSGGRR